MWSKLRIMQSCVRLTKAGNEILYVVALALVCNFFGHWRGQFQWYQRRGEKVVDFQHGEIVCRWVDIWRNRSVFVVGSGLDSCGLAETKQVSYSSTSKFKTSSSEISCHSGSSSDRILREKNSS